LWPLGPAFDPGPRLSSGKRSRFLQLRRSRAQEDEAPCAVLARLPDFAINSVRLLPRRRAIFRCAQQARHVHNGVHNRVVNDGQNRVATGRYGQRTLDGLSTKTARRRTRRLFT
jgi:hypothetical protein